MTRHGVAIVNSGSRCSRSPARGLPGYARLTAQPSPAEHGLWGWMGKRTEAWHTGCRHCIHNLGCGGWPWLAADEKARQMEALVVELAAGAAGARQQAQGPGEAVPDNGLGALRHMLDVSMLKYQVGWRAVTAGDLTVAAVFWGQTCPNCNGAWGGNTSLDQRPCIIARCVFRDARNPLVKLSISIWCACPPQERDLVVEALQRWRSSVPYDAVKGWDARARKWYGDRYDFRRNMVGEEAVPVGLSGAGQGGRCWAPDGSPAGADTLGLLYRPPAWLPKNANARQQFPPYPSNCCSHALGIRTHGRCSHTHIGNAFYCYPHLRPAAHPPPGRLGLPHAAAARRHARG